MYRYMNDWCPLEGKSGLVEKQGRASIVSALPQVYQCSQLWMKTSENRGQDKLPLFEGSTVCTYLPAVHILSSACSNPWLTQVCLSTVSPYPADSHATEPPYFCGNAGYSLPQRTAGYHGICSSQRFQCSPANTWEISLLCVGTLTGKGLNTGREKYSVAFIFKFLQYSVQYDVSK